MDSHAQCQHKASRYVQQKNKKPVVMAQPRQVARASWRPEERLCVREARRPRCSHRLFLLAQARRIVRQAQLCPPSNTRLALGFHVDDTGMAAQHMHKMLQYFKGERSVSNAPPAKRHSHLTDSLREFRCTRDAHSCSSRPWPCGRRSDAPHNRIAALTCSRRTHGPARAPALSPRAPPPAARSRTGSRVEWRGRSRRRRSRRSTGTGCPRPRAGSRPCPWRPP